MDTPGVQHAGNYTGRALKPAPFVDAPETTAEAIVRLAAHPRPEVVVGVMAKLARFGHGLAPGLVEWGLGRFIELYLDQADRSIVAVRQRPLAHARPHEGPRPLAQPR